MENLVRDISSDELPFINAEIGGSKLDFEFSVDYETNFRDYLKNGAMGVVGEMPVGINNTVQMRWETGLALPRIQTMLHCSYDNSTCYQAKVVPVIFDMSAHSGYSNGGMNLTITGHGFDNGTINATVDGIPCKVTS